MTTFSRLLAATLLAAAASAQSPLLTIYATNNGGSVGGAFYFDLTLHSAVEFHQIDLNVAGSTLPGTAGSVDVYIGCVPDFRSPNHQNAADWVQVATGSGTSAPPNTPTMCPLAQPLHLPSGDYTIALVLNGWAHAYTTGVGGTSTFSNNELTLETGGASNAPFTGAQFFPRIWNGALHYSTSPTVPATTVRCAEVTNYGAGCYEGASSFYEGPSALSSFDLRGAASGLPGTENTIVLTANGQSGYVVSQGSSSWFPPVGAPVLSQSLVAMSDDSMSTALPVPAHWNGNTGTWSHTGGSVTQFHACSNGYVVLGATTTSFGDFSPTVAEFLATAGDPGTARLAPCWADLHPGRNVSVNPLAGIYYGIDPNGSTVYITWFDVGSYQNSTPGADRYTFQVAIHESGDIEYRYGRMDTNPGSSAFLAGWSQGDSAGSPATDPGPRDISATMPFTTNGPDLRPLRLDADARPILGTTIHLVTTEVPSTANATVTFLALGQQVPGIELGSIGAPDCFQHIDLQNGSSSTWLFGTPTVSMPWSIPNNTGYVGVRVYAQSVALDPPSNGCGCITSNGVKMVLGTH